jgi:hypothetical protein
MTLHVHIERLVLDGLPVTRAQRGTLAAALEAELGRLLAAKGIGPSLAAGGALARLRADDLRFGTADAIGLGTRIATAVHTGMHR